MNIKKLITAVVIAVLFSAGLFYAFPAIAPTEEIAGVFSNYFSLPSCSIIGVAFAAVYLLFASRKKAIADGDIPMKEYDWLYQHAGDEAKAQMAALSDEDKLRYVATMKGILSQDKKNALSNYVHELKTPKRPAAMKAASWLALIAVTAYVGQQGYEAYTAVQPMMEAYLAQQNATYEDQILYIDGLPPIQLILTTEDFVPKQNDVDYFIETKIKTQPQFLLDNCKLIKIYNGNFWNEVKKEHAVEDYAYAFASSSDMSISIQYNEKAYYYGTGIIAKEVFDSETITHELSHIFDYRYSISRSPEFLNLYQAAPNSVTEYGATNEWEFFAEAGEMYIHAPEELQRKNIDVYNYFDALYGPYMKQ